jgi:hypothetical protein
LAGSLVTAGFGGQVSNSWGVSEFLGETSNDGTFNASKVVYFAASGDRPGTLWPAVSPNVIAIGGTTISRKRSTGNYISQSAWSSGGGGPSKYEGRPSYQSSISTIVGSSGVWIYDSAGGGWIVVGGTSVASPVMAGITNLQGAFRLSSNAELTHLMRPPQGNGGLGLLHRRRSAVEDILMRSTHPQESSLEGSFAVSLGRATRLRGTIRHVAVPGKAARGNVKRERL